MAGIHEPIPKSGEAYDEPEVKLAEKVGQSLCDMKKELSDKTRQLELRDQQIEELNKKLKKIEKLYYDTFSYARGLENNPAVLGKRRILKAFIKSFTPGFVQRAGSKALNGVRGIRQWIQNRRPDYVVWLKNSAARTKKREKLESRPLISILVPLYNTDRRMLGEMIESCLRQTYENFELCLADASDENHGYVYETAAGYAKKDPRVKLKKLQKNLGISGNTNECRKMASGEYLALLDHDDLLIEHALYEVARAINESDPDVMYSDEDHLREGKRCQPFFKPDFNRDLLYSQMYICHFLSFRAELFDRAGGLRDDFSGSQDYDLMLRLTEQTDRIAHIPDVLYSWRETASSTSVNPNSKPYAHDAGKNALDSHLKRVYGGYAHAEDSEYLFVYDARFDLLSERPLVSIIIPTKDHADLLEACVESILEKTVYGNYEILILDNNSEREETFSCFERLKERDKRIRVLDAFFEFNWSKLNNFGIDNSRGEVFVFLNNDTLVISPDWLERLAENALRKDVGVVGALLLYEDDTIQHAGVVIGMNGWADHVYKGMPQVHAADRFVSPMVNRDVLAVTGACMAISRETIERIGRFDESFIVCGSDAEMCIRAHDNGLSVLYNARVRLYHLESKSRDISAVPEIDFIRSEEEYREFRTEGDPYYNCNLDPNSTVPRAAASRKER